MGGNYSSIFVDRIDLLVRKRRTRTFNVENYCREKRKNTRGRSWAPLHLNRVHVFTTKLWLDEFFLKKLLVQSKWLNLTANIPTKPCFHVFRRSASIFRHHIYINWSECTWRNVRLFCFHLPSMPRNMRIGILILKIISLKLQYLLKGSIVGQDNERCLRLSL